MDDIEAEVDREAVTEDSLDNDNDSSAVVSDFTKVSLFFFFLEISPRFCCLRSASLFNVVGGG